MNRFIQFSLKPASSATIHLALLLMRIGVGILTIGHGYPKFMSGFEGWHGIGLMFMAPLGITFLPTLWGFLGAITEFIGGIMFTIGFGTRLASAANVIMMIIATSWHITKGDPFNVYSYPLTLIVVFGAYFLMGAGIVSVDAHLAKE